MGAELKPDKIYDGVIHKGKASVWIALNPEDLIGYPDTEEESQTIRQKLGSKPESYILLDVAKASPQSEQLGVEIACKLGARWPCVVDNLSGPDWKVFSNQELCQLEINGKGFL